MMASVFEHARGSLQGINKKPVKDKDKDKDKENIKPARRALQDISNKGALKDVDVAKPKEKEKVPEKEKAPEKEKEKPFKRIFGGRPFAATATVESLARATAPTTKNLMSATLPVPLGAKPPTKTANPSSATSIPALIARPPKRNKPLDSKTGKSSFAALGSKVKSSEKSSESKAPSDDLELDRSGSRMVTSTTSLTTSEVVSNTSSTLAGTGPMATITEEKYGSSPMVDSPPTEGGHSPTHSPHSSPKASEPKSEKARRSERKERLAAMEEEPKGVGWGKRMSDEDEMDMSLEDAQEVPTIPPEPSEAEKSDPQMVPDYIQDIMAYFKEIEGKRQPNAQYMRRQPDVDEFMREILVDWLIGVHNQFKLQVETLFLTINLLDRFLEIKAIHRRKLQLVGCTSMFLASKYEERHAPLVKDFIYVSANNFEKNEVLEMESIMLNILQFNLTVPTSHRFLERYLKAVVGCDDQLANLAEYYLELTLPKYEFLKYLPSQVASSALYIALKTTGLRPWDSTMVAQTQFTEASLEPCIRELHAIIVEKNPKCSVRRKFSVKKYGEVAKLPVWNGLSKKEGTTTSSNNTGGETSGTGF